MTIFTLGLVNFGLVRFIFKFLAVTSVRINIMERQLSDEINLVYSNWFGSFSFQLLAVTPVSIIS